jgi:hypothetical protein
MSMLVWGWEKVILRARLLMLRGWPWWEKIINEGGGALIDIVFSEKHIFKGLQI